MNRFTLQIREAGNKRFRTVPTTGLIWCAAEAYQSILSSKELDGEVRVLGPNGKVVAYADLRRSP